MMKNRLLQLEQQLTQAIPQSKARSQSRMASALSADQPLTVAERELRDRPLDFLKKYTVSPAAGVMLQTGHLIAGGTRAETLQMMIFDRAQEVRIPPGQPFHNELMPNSAGLPDPEAVKRSTIERPDKAIALTRLDREMAGIGIELKLIAYSPANIPNSKLDNYLPVWFLPWQSNHITELTILPSNITQPCGLLNPDLFFTTALTGCSVFVQGPPTSPTIFHIGSQFKPPGERPQDDPKRPGEYWRAIHQTISPGSGAKEVNKTHYFDSNPHLVTLKQRLERQLPFNGYTMDALSLSAYDCCVFGVRDATTGQWSFYYQRNAQVEYWLYRDRQQRESTARRRVMPLVTQFYPGDHTDISTYPDLKP